VLFRLTHAPQLGLFVFTSGNWLFAEDLLAAASVLCDRDGMVSGFLSLERVSGRLTTGQAVVFSQPALSLLADGPSS
jgi:hypothetical protein